MNTTRIIELRQAQGWTQERLATESGVGVRTVQRLEAGEDASLETLSLVAEALRVPVRDLFSIIDDADLTSRVDSLEARASEQQAARDRTTRAWLLLYVGIGVVLTLVAFTIPNGLALFLAYWLGGTLIAVALRRLLLEPRLDARYPLSRSTRTRRQRRREQRAAERVAGSAHPDGTAEDVAPAPARIS
ncbi:XRE family transcriptional regulator [Clavibacter michiganensis]|uniref:XRE family transcriptional regulator n=1 Tax=Clavibacter michiganensis TaxID=28447 RepID=A0A2S5VVK0_9MICO|nr:helix-turn-helix transcriptional regulator [Clavibacter michiganensis]PPF68879.1 XRE family transcriptional regulator [Clavibacter michiganensis]